MCTTQQVVFTVYEVMVCLHMGQQSLSAIQPSAQSQWKACPQGRRLSVAVSSNCSMQIAQ